MLETGLRILTGVLLLLFGRKLFWMFVGILGFLSGFFLASQFLQGQSEIVLWGIALLAGIIGIFLAFFLQRLAIAISGFIAGSYLALQIWNQYSPEKYTAAWLIIILIGGILGAILLSMLFDYALIVLSSITGALLISEITPYPIFVFFGLLIVGVVIQLSMMRKRPVVPP